MIRKTIPPMTCYLILTGSLAFIWIYGIGFNLGTVALIALIAALAVVGSRSAKRKRTIRKRKPV